MFNDSLASGRQPSINPPTLADSYVNTSDIQLDSPHYPRINAQSTAFSVSPSLPALQVPGMNVLAVGGDLPSVGTMRLNTTSIPQASSGIPSPSSEGQGLIFLWFVQFPSNKLYSIAYFLKIVRIEVRFFLYFFTYVITI